ncbi:U3 small nucleolar ribonucleoprotein protein MPP10-like isoform X2 [Artemia franciscana]|uniref:U3 small nucleolar ribonucleoprotein protein MPP10-like isoform X2 n=1 Tax=Artemia franciscana TaxID=6661 RepID=UPI0032DBD101
MLTMSDSMVDFDHILATLPKPISFLKLDKEKAKGFQIVSKELYDSTFKEEKEHKGYLNRLLIDGFDEEQIWQQLELCNDNQLNVLTASISKLLVKDQLRFIEEENDTEAAEPFEEEEEDDENRSNSDLSELDLKTDSENDSEEDNFDDLFNDADENESDEDEETDKEGEKEKKVNSGPMLKKFVKPSIVDDKFFKLSEMEEFLKREDRKEENGGDEDDEDSIDYFAEDESDVEGSDNDESGPRFRDFFDNPADSGVGSTNAESIHEEADVSEPLVDSTKKVRFEFDEQSSAKETEIRPNESKSSFEKRQEKLRATIKSLEEEALAPKSWQLGGEVVAEARPENALLEEDLIFDHVTRQAPIITEEVNRTLEEIINQRIKDQAWDDVERKIKPVLDPYDFKKRLVLDQEKSKLSLAEIYEQEYLKAQEKTEEKNPRLLDPLEVDVNEAHEKIKSAMESLFMKLDALGNYHYTPKLPTPKVKILTTTPALAVDEVVPISVSDQALLAPEEIKEKPRGEVKGQTERTITDKKRERRMKKSLQHDKRLRKEDRERENKDSNNKTAALEKLVKSHKEGKISTLKEIDKIENSLKSSRAFFAKLQDEVTANMTKEKEKGKKRKVKTKKGVSAKKLRTS